MREVIHIIEVMLMCNATFGFFYIGMHRRGIGYTDHFLVTTAYFLSIAAVTAYVFKNYIERVLAHVSFLPLFVFAVVMFVIAAVHIYFPRYVAEPSEYFARYPDRYYLKIDWRRFIAKSMDILAQQVFIILLVLFLHDAGLSLIETTAAFMALFAILHIPLISSEWGAWPAYLFSGAVICFSLIFPVMILTVPYGFVYNYLFHWLFYIITAVVFWLYKLRQNDIQVTSREIGHA